MSNHIKFTHQNLHLTVIIQKENYKIWSPNVGLDPTTLRLSYHALPTELAGLLIN